MLLIQILIIVAIFISLVAIYGHSFRQKDPVQFFKYGFLSSFHPKLIASILIFPAMLGFFDERVELSYLLKNNLVWSVAMPFFYLIFIVAYCYFLRRLETQFREKNSQSFLFWFIKNFFHLTWEIWAMLVIIYFIDVN